MQILIVSPDVQTLAPFAHHRQTPEADWRVIQVASADEALDALARDSFHLVMVEDLLDGEPGTNLLRAVRQQSPETIRFLLIDAVADGLMNESNGLVHRYLSKHLDPDAIFTAVKQVGTLTQLLQNQALRRMIAEIGTLPSIPSDYQRVLAAVNDPQTSLRELGDLVAQDVSMTAQVLRFVNSAYFGIQYTISTPQQAVVMLGTETTRALVTAVKVLSTFQSPQVNRLAEQLYQHSIAVGLCARQIVTHMGADTQRRDEAVVTGILHDLGKLILLTYLPDQGQEIVRLSQQRQIPLWQAEYERLGISHAEIGGYWIGLCGLPDAIVQAIAFHHRPQHCHAEATDLLTAVHVADVYVNHGVDENEDADAEDAVQVAQNRLDLDYLAQQGVVEQVVHWQALCRQILAQNAPRQTKPNESQPESAPPAAPVRTPDDASTPGFLRPLARVWRMLAGSA